MTEPTGPTETNSAPGPVVTAATIQALLAVAVTIGWVTLDDNTVKTVATAIAVLIAVVTTWFARSRVTPTANPRDASGTPLVPATDPPAPDPAPPSPQVTVDELVGKHRARNPTDPRGPDGDSR